MFQCSICNTSFPSTEVLSFHIISTHSSQNLQPNDTKKRYLCEICGASFSTKFNLKRHIQRCPKKPDNQNSIIDIKRKAEIAKESRRCRNCNKQFTRNENLKKHESSCGGSILVSTTLLHDARRKNNHVGETKCSKCDKVFVNRTKFLDHWSKCRMGGVRNTLHTFAYRCLSCNRHFDDLESKRKHYNTCVGGGVLDDLQDKYLVLNGKVFKNTSFTYDVVPTGEYNHLTNQSLWLMVNAIQSVIQPYQDNREQYRAFKVRAVLFSDLTAQTNAKKVNSAVEDLINLNSFTYTCYPATNIKSAIIEPIYRDLVTKLDEFEHRGSGWRLKTFNKLTVTIDVINPLRVAACNSNEHMLPLNLAKKTRLTTDFLRCKLSGQSLFQMGCVRVPICTISQQRW